MTKIIIYKKTYCPYCVKAKALLDKKKVQYEEIDITHKEDLHTALIEKTGGQRTVPQIFINDKHIGGCDDLYSLEKEGKLDGLLK